MTPILLSDKDHRGVVRLSLNRPDKHNALNADLIALLTSTLQSLDQDASVRIIILTGEGVSFCSGADLEWMKASANFDEQSNYQDAKNLAELMSVIYSLSKPTVTRVNGSAYGGGLGLIACSDIAIACDQAKFAFTEVRLGLIPAVISPYIVNAMGARRTQQLFMTAQRFSAQQALDSGLLHHCVKEGELDVVVEQTIVSLLKAGPHALHELKLLNQQLSLIQHGVDLAQWIARLRVSEEGQAGIQAFLNKTPPPWCE